jgi:hypothetical protein
MRKIRKIFSISTNHTTFITVTKSVFPKLLPLVYFDVPGKYDRLHLSKASAKGFLEQVIPKFRKWYVDFHWHWTEVRKYSSEETAWEEQLNHVEEDISRLMS